MYYQEEIDKKARNKIIAVATVAIMLILALLVAIIVVATKKAQPLTVSDTEASVSVEAPAEPEVSVAENTAKPTEEATANDLPAVTVGELFPAETKTEAKAETKVASNMPSTGPEEALPLALMAGAFVAYLASRKLGQEA